jgi:hypothetical protein
MFDIGNHFGTDVHGDELITPYAAMRLVNRALAELGVDKELPGPMLYTYVKKGYIGGTKGAKRCTRQAVATWFEKYVVRFLEVEEVDEVDSEA